MHTSYWKIGGLTSIQRGLSGDPLRFALVWAMGSSGNSWVSCCTNLWSGTRTPTFSVVGLKSSGSPDDREKIRVTGPGSRLSRRDLDTVTFENLKWIITLNDLASYRMQLTYESDLGLKQIIQVVFRGTAASDYIFFLNVAGGWKCRIWCPWVMQ